VQAVEGYGRGLLGDVSF